MMGRGVALLLALCAMPAMAGEVTVMRPKGFIAQDWPNYILISDRVVTDLLPGERVTLQVSAETRSLVVHCPRGLGGYDESRIDYDFNANPTAYFVIAAAPDCVRIQPLDARAAASPMRQTTPRFAGRAVEYQAGGPIIRPGAPATSPVASTASPAASADAGPVAAATAAWVEAFNSRDPGRIAALYDAEAVLSDTAEPKPRVGAAAIADYYKSAAQRSTQRVALGERNVRMLGDTAIDSGTLTYFEMRDGNATTTPGRYSLTYHRRGGKWMIVDQQLSTTPR
jgi:uncharacterized protein (TIGR02246 family)